MPEQPDKDTAAQELAQRHYQIEEGITQIIRLNQAAEVEARATEPIKLLEINANTVPSGVMPLFFGPEPDVGIHFPSVIVEVTPDEFEKIKRHELKLPEGWRLGSAIPKKASKIKGSRRA